MSKNRYKNIQCDKPYTNSNIVSPTRISDCQIHTPPPCIPSAPRVSPVYERKIVKCTEKKYFEEFQNTFHLPLTDAAKHFGIRETAFKKRCRTLGISKWPYRQVNSLKHKVKKLEDKKISSPYQRRSVRNEKDKILRLQRQLAYYYDPHTYGT